MKGSLLWLFLTIFLIFMEEVKAQEGCLCYDLYQPICGSDGNTYGNACELNCARKSNPYIFGLCKGACPCCKPIYEMDPNENQEQIGFWEPPPVEVQPVEPAPTPVEPLPEEGNETPNYCTDSVSAPDCFCIALYDPVCGSDGKTYGNGCELACQQRYRPCLQEACKGACPCCPCTGTGIVPLKANQTVATRL